MDPTKNTPTPSSTSSDTNSKLSSPNPDVSSFFEVSSSDSPSISATEPLTQPEAPEAPDPTEAELDAPFTPAAPVPGSIGSAISVPPAADTETNLTNPAPASSTDPLVAKPRPAAAPAPAPKPADAMPKIATPETPSAPAPSRSAHSVPNIPTANAQPQPAHATSSVADAPTHATSSAPLNHIAPQGAPDAFASLSATPDHNRSSQPQIQNQSPANAAPANPGLAHNSVAPANATGGQNPFAAASPTPSVSFDEPAPVSPGKPEKKKNNKLSLIILCAVAAVIVIILVIVLIVVNSANSSTENASMTTEDNPISTSETLSCNATINLVDYAELFASAGTADLSVFDDDAEEAADSDEEAAEDAEESESESDASDATPVASSTLAAFVLNPVSSEEITSDNAADEVLVLSDDITNAISDVIADFSGGYLSTLDFTNELVYADSAIASDAIDNLNPTSTRLASLGLITDPFETRAVISENNPSSVLISGSAGSASVTNSALQFIYLDPDELGGNAPDSITVDNLQAYLESLGMTCSVQQ